MPNTYRTYASSAMALAPTQTVWLGQSIRLSLMVLRMIVLIKSSDVVSQITLAEKARDDMAQLRVLAD